LKQEVHSCTIIWVFGRTSTRDDRFENIPRVSVT